MYVDARERRVGAPVAAHREPTKAAVGEEVVHLGVADERRVVGQRERERNGAVAAVGRREARRRRVAKQRGLVIRAAAARGQVTLNSGEFALSL